MRVRIRQSPLGDTWFVEEKKSWLHTWVMVESFYRDDAYQRAVEYAKRLKRPVIVEVD